MAEPSSPSSPQGGDEVDWTQMPAEDVIRLLEASGVFQGQEDVPEKLRAFAARGIHPLQVLRMDSRPPQETPGEKLLETFDLEGIARYIVEKGCKRVVVMCGAGISTSAGIPDFRTPGTGLYDNLQRFNLPRAEAIFDLSYFRQRPGAFYELCKEMWPGNFNPTPAHYFVRLLHEKGMLLRCYSQNIDSLEIQAGLPADKLVAAHGNFDGAHVIDTEPEVQVEIAELKAALENGEDGWQGLAQKYGGLVKPKIVFFGEALPDRFSTLHLEDLPSCDLLIVMGTSLEVHPFAGLVGQASPEAPRLLINRQAVGSCEELQNGFRFHLSEGQNWRDAFCAGDCDSGCRALAAALGWTEELEALVSSRGAGPKMPAVSTDDAVQAEARGSDPAGETAVEQSGSDEERWICSVH